MQKKKHEIVEDLASKVKEPKVAEYLYRMAGMKSTLRGKASNDLIQDTCKFLLDVIFEDKLQNIDEAKTIQADEQETNETFQDATDQDDESSRENNSKSLCNTNDNPKQRSSKDDKTSEWSNNKKICYYWRKGKCNKGASCKFDHPRICGVFMKFGLKKYRNDSNGCDTGCNRLHPFICKYSLKYATCRYENCKYQHTSTTKVRNEDLHSKEKTESKSEKPSCSQINGVKSTQCPSEPVQNNQPFLSMDCLRLLIREAIQMEMGYVTETGKSNKNRQYLPTNMATPQNV